MTHDFVLALVLAIVCAVLLEGSSIFIAQRLMRVNAFLRYPSRYRHQCDVCITNRIEQENEYEETVAYATAKTNIGLVHILLALGFVRKSAGGLLAGATVDNASFLSASRTVVEGAVMPVAILFRAVLMTALISIVLHPSHPSSAVVGWSIFGVTAALGLVLDVWTARELRRGRKRAMVGVLAVWLTLPGIPAYGLLMLNQSWNCSGMLLLISAVMTTWTSWTLLSSMRIKELEAV